MRSTTTGLVGNTLNVDSLTWERYDASIGAGADSFYEYMLKVGDIFFCWHFPRHPFAGMTGLTIAQSDVYEIACGLFRGGTHAGMR